MSRSRVVACTTQRNEPDWMLEDLHTNLAGWVDEIVVLQVPKTGPWLHEGEQNARKRAMLAKAGAQWAMHIDPDERIEDRAAHVIPLVLRRGAPGTMTVLGFPLREMWTPTAYRMDGDWGNKLPRMRLWRFDAPGLTYAHKAIHSPSTPRGSRYFRHTLDLNMYHLKNIEPANRVERAKAYMAADPNFEHQRPETRARNWNWLVDETGLLLEEIPEGRGFSPSYTRPYEFKAPE